MSTATYSQPVTEGFDAPADYYADPDVARLAGLVVALRGTLIAGTVAADLIEACDGDTATARAVVALARQDQAQQS